MCLLWKQWDLRIIPLGQAGAENEAEPGLKFLIRYDDVQSRMGTQNTERKLHDL